MSCFYCQNYPFSLMGQYPPINKAADHPIHSRKVTEQEMQNVLELAMELGLTDVLYQEGLSDEDALTFRGDRIKYSLKLKV